MYKNSLLVALATASLGTLIVYGTALVSARRGEHRHYGKLPDTVSLVTNTIPGMVLGVSYLLSFKGTFLHNTFAILVICNIVHYFSSPYLMMKSSLEKLNASWETTARLMGDSWLKTVVRIITPNAVSTLLEVFSYFFVNAMVTVSAVIFLASTRTMIITAKIKELQHFAMAMDMMPIMNVFNEWHAANTSKKIRAVIEANAKSGKYRTTFAPYGYVKGDDKNRLPVVDEPAASVVRRIFDMRSKGISPRHIADTLNAEGIPIRLLHKQNLYENQNIKPNNKEYKKYDKFKGYNS